MNSQAGSGKFGVAQHISLGTNDQPVPIAFKVVPIYNALNWSYWQPVRSYMSQNIECLDVIKHSC